MTISSISSSSSSINQLATMRTRASSGETQQAAGPRKPDFSKMFSTMDADSSGGLDSTEVQSLAEKISEATGVSVDLSEFLATYDSDGDGSLSEEETLASLEANRPQGSSSNAENLASASGGIDSVLAEAIDNYLKMAELGMNGQASGDLYSMLESSSSSISNVA